MDPAPAHIIIGGTEEHATEDFDLGKLKEMYEFLFLIQTAMTSRPERRIELVRLINRHPFMRGTFELPVNETLSQIIKLRDLAEEKILEYLEKCQNIRL